jgi:hypothetical protein
MWATSRIFKKTPKSKRSPTGRKFAQSDHPGLKVRTVGQRQGCQRVYFQTKNSNLGKFWRALEWKMLVYFMTILSILRPNGIVYGSLAHFVVIWYAFSRFGMLYREKFGPFGIFNAVWCSVWSFGISFPFWYVWTKKNLATLVKGRMQVNAQNNLFPLTFTVWILLRE